ncbi:hypothetical protein KCU85_g9379, partial [Aureobasidium melanogenum]
MDNGLPHVVAEAGQSTMLCATTTQGSSSQQAFLNRIHSEVVFQSPTPSTHDPTNDIADQSRHIVKDLRLLTNGRSAAEFPTTLAYAAVPMRAASGRFIGIFAVIDSTPRNDFANGQTYSVLSDIASAILSHVESQTAQCDSNNRDMQAKSDLSTFLEHNRPQHPRHLDSSTLPPTVVRSLASNSRRISTSATSSSSDATSLTQSLDQIVTSDAGTPLTTPADDASASYFVKPPSIPASISFSTNKDHVTQPEDASAKSGRHRAQKTLSSAAGLIRAAHQLEGLVILSTASNSTDNTHDPSDDSMLHQSSLCQKLVTSIVANTNTPARIATSMSVEHDSLHYLTSQFPQGCVLKTEDKGVSALVSMGISRTGPARYEELIEASAIPSDLQSLLEKAQSLVFMPLWDSARQAFYAGMLGWPSSPTRVFTEHDLLSMSIYGRILTAEVTHFDATETEATKSDFVSSLSHELRSPLHGCLAAVEVLRDTNLDKSQTDLLGMIESCASTLLYTMNHLLDFSKVNHLDRAQSMDRRASSLSTTTQNAPRERFGQTSEDYLCRVVQDVVEGVAYGHHREQVAHHKDVNALRQDTTMAFGIEEQLETTDDVAVFLFMESHAAWFSLFSAGAWKRLVMNLFGNSLKFCSSGHIEVTLKLLPDPQNPKRRMSHLMVRDTGIGMSEEFIKHSLYRPFSQANSLTMGTGLGLSIVKQIVDDMQGVIHVDSSLGIGTQFDVFVPVVERESIPEGLTLNGGQVLDPDELLRGLTVCLLIPHRATTESNFSSLERTRLVHSYVSRIAQNWFNMKVVYAKMEEEVDADLYVAEAFNHALVRKNRTILVGNQRQLAQIRSRSPHDFVELMYPLGPRALVRALHTVIEKPNYQVSRLATPVTTTDSLTQVPENVASTTVVTAEEQIERPKSSDTIIHKQPIRTEHLLLVDDNSINLKLLSTFIKKMGMDACTAVDGEDALLTYKAYAQGRPFTTILMDISMPKMNGFESTRAIRDYEVEHDLPRSRVIALTALSSEASRREAEASGLNEFLVKPVSLKTLKSLFNHES